MRGILCKMNTVTEHYDNHLAEVYSWMAGDWDAALERYRTLLAKTPIDSRPRGRAIDLGCGSGFQSIPLAEMGFKVSAIDLSNDLLDELRKHSETLPVEIIHSDILNYLNTQENGAEVIVCMGDTLTHLPNYQSVLKVIEASARILADDGVLILAFRDYASPLTGITRFIPVQSSSTRIATCFLEFFDDFIEVTDLFYNLTDGQWKLSASSYPKIRLAPDQICEELKSSGFSVTSNECFRGMFTIVAQKESP